MPEDSPKELKVIAFGDQWAKGLLTVSANIAEGLTLT